jgi:hypothetical protein
MRNAIPSFFAAVLVGMTGSAAAAEAAKPEFHPLTLSAEGKALGIAPIDPTPAPVETAVRATLASDGSVRTQCEVVANPAFEAWQKRRNAAHLAERQQ